jgi:DNA repair exonuclease SbcCD ATPase subunit
VVPLRTVLFAPAAFGTRPGFAGNLRSLDAEPEGLPMWIEALRIEGGMLDGFDQRFDQQLNVVIGGRGTGKSSMIELIRFCLGATSYTNSGQQQSTEHALGVLGDGRVVVTLTDGHQQTEIVRTAQDELSDETLWIDPPFVFSQSEIETIGLHAQSRLRLIDDFLPPEGSPKLEEATLTSKIRSATAEIRSLLTEVDDISEKTVALPTLLQELEAAKTQSAAQSIVHKEIVTHRASLAELTPQVAAARVRSETITRVADRLTDWSQTLDNLLDRKPTIEPWPVQAGTTDELIELRKKEKQALARLTVGLAEFQEITQELERKKNASSSQRVGLENRARDIRQKIEEKQKGASALDKRISDLTQQISVLKSLIDLRADRELRLKQLNRQRSAFVAQLLQGRQVRTKQREQVAANLNKELGPVIRVTVTPLSQYREYISTLSAALRGSGLRYTELADRIAKVFTPQEIATLAESRDIDTISSTLEITDERALRICDALRADAAGGLFITTVEDDIQIELMDGADYKGIDFLSMGQRCTTILPIILSHKDRIIILDQPEDHLDNAFVVGTLVKAVLTRSVGAQTIVATHNPNIPVLGDAERVIHLDSDGTRCFVRSAGSIDTPRIVEGITTIMEGGRDAFRRRAEFYTKNSH